MTKKVLIGADPEFFLSDAKTRIPVSAHGLVPGTKKEPHKLECGAVQLDGTAVEFNIEPAATSFEFEYNISNVLKQVRKMIPTTYDFNFSPSVVYSQKYFDAIPAPNKELGCDPDYDALSKNPWLPNNPPRSFATTMRTGAGHIHVGFVDKKDPLEECHFWDCIELAKRLNSVLSVARKVWDQDTTRYALYGGGAAFRPKSYGLEYRSPSNAWLNFPKLWSWLFETTREILYRTVDNDVRLEDFKPLMSPVYFNYRNPTSKEVFGIYNKKAAEIKMPLIPDDWNAKVAVA